MRLRLYGRRLLSGPADDTVAEPVAEPVADTGPHADGPAVEPVVEPTTRLADDPNAVIWDAHPLRGTGPDRLDIPVDPMGIDEGVALPDEATPGQLLPDDPAHTDDSPPPDTDHPQVSDQPDLGNAIPHRRRSAPPPGDRFDFSYGLLSRLLLGALGMGKRSSWVVVDDTTVHVRMGWAFRTEIPRNQILGTYLRADRVLSRGVHVWRGRWLVNGSGDDLVTITLDRAAVAEVRPLPMSIRRLTMSISRADDLVALVSGTSIGDEGTTNRSSRR